MKELIELVNKNSGVIQILVSIIALGIAVYSLRFSIKGFKKEREERNKEKAERDNEIRHEKEIEKKERILHTFIIEVMQILGRENHRCQRYSLNKEYIWKLLDEIYEKANKEGGDYFTIFGGETKESLKEYINRTLLKDWNNISSLGELREIDQVVRKEYYLNDPKDMNDKDIV